MAKIPITFPHPYPRTARLLHQARSAREAQRSFTSGTKELAPTESELLTAGIGRHVIPLRSSWPNLLNDLFSLGQVRMVTAGASAFVEKRGVYPLPEFSGSCAAFLDGRMNLVVRLEEWKRAFAVFPTLGEKTSFTEYGLHFFNGSGAAMHRIFLSPSGSIEAFERIADEYRHDGAAESLCAPPVLSPQSELSVNSDMPESDRDRKPGRTESTRKVESYEVLRALHNCRQERLHIRMSVGTAGCVHTHAGVIRDMDGGPFWTCAIDDDTIFYVRDADIVETHIIETATEDGRSLSLEAFDARGRMVLTLDPVESGNDASKDRWNYLLEGLPDV